MKNIFKNSNQTPQKLVSHTIPNKYKIRIICCRASKAANDLKIAGDQDKVQVVIY